MTGRAPFDRVGGIPVHPHDGSEISGELTYVSKVGGVSVDAHAVRHNVGGADELIPAWAPWTPTYVNITPGNGTVVASFVQIGKLVVCRYELTFGSTTTIGSDPSVSLPITASAGYTADHNYVGQALFHDDDVGIFFTGLVALGSTTTMEPRAIQAGFTYTSAISPSATVPMTWATGDVLFMQAQYQEA